MRSIQRLLFFIQLICVLPAIAQSSRAVNSSNALQEYLHNGDSTYQFTVKDKYQEDGVTTYNVLLRSQTWRGIPWTHQLAVFVPGGSLTDAALLFITGGSVKNGLPNWNGPDDELFQSMQRIASANHSIVAVLRQTPNQPLYGDLTEDALISYTLHQFKQDHDYSWPLLFPMVKSAVRAMDVIAALSSDSLRQPVKRFVLSGASKRGWTTWLSGANDPRVVAIAPMVIDILNMPVSLEYQLQAWKQYSIQIEDYVKLGIVQSARTESGKEITDMIDPYSYRQQLGMPKMIFMGTNDEYWVVDAVKNYIDSIPGTNMICYTPNAGHDLGDKRTALTTLSAFFGNAAHNRQYPTCRYTVSKTSGAVSVSVSGTPSMLKGARLWWASSSNMLFTGSKWTSRDLSLTGEGRVHALERLPLKGNKAFYIDLIYSDATGGQFTQSTRMFVVNRAGLKR